jgi:spore maturation protein CgeB
VKLVFLGLSLSSSWGNGHATTYRGLLAALAREGHDILFLERDQPWYAAQRDLPQPDFCRFALYRAVGELVAWRRDIERADAVILGSYVPEGIEVARQVIRTARGVVAFYDIDTPVTLASLAAGGCAYLAADLIPAFDLYLSFTGGPILTELEQVWGARAAHPLYCSVDPQRYAPVPAARRWALGYLGTYSEDRQPALDRLLLEPARRRPDLRFVVAGPQYPPGIHWPGNVDRIEHLGPADHPEFYCSLDWTLNVTRADMRRTGWSPSVRLFEAAACACPIVSDSWPGLEDVLRPDSEIAVADTSSDILALLDRPREAARSIGEAARARVLSRHTAAHRARQFQAYAAAALGSRARLLAAAG